MSEVRKCECGKTISATLAFCWECWNKSGKNVPEHYCSCGLDVSYKEAKKECTHQEPPLKMTREQYRSIEFAGMVSLDKSNEHWVQFEVSLAKENLLEQIDIALEKGLKEEFLELAAKLNQLTSMS